MENETTPYLIIGVLLIIFLIIVTIFFINYSKEHHIFGRNESDDTYIISSFEIIAKQGDVRLYLPYELYQGDKVVQEGTLKQGYKSEYNDVRNNTNYTLTILTKDYYFDDKTCTIRNDVCQINLEKKAEPIINHLMYKDFTRIIMFVDDGLWKDYAFCVQENTDRITGLSYDIPLEEIKLVDDRYDRCYQFTNHTLNKGLHEFSIHFRIDDRFDYEDGDRIRLLFMDNYNISDNKRVSYSIENFI